MKGSECKVLAFMSGGTKRFIIPVYQRNYDWKIENCKQLYDDLVKIIKNERPNHFFGSIVSVSGHNANGTISEYTIIDGQQRLTTVTLILLAMHNLLKEDNLTSQDRSLKDKIYDYYLVDKYAGNGEQCMILKPVKNDREAYQKLYDEDKAYIKSSNLTINYNYFYERIKKQEITVDDLFIALNKLEIISITLDSYDKPQLIFESLNSTGLDLSEGDKIRNFILMGLSNAEQEKFYDKYWNPIEKYTNYDVSSFVRDYLSLKEQEIPPQKKVYKKFKDYIDVQNIETEELLKDLLAYAKRYNKLLTGMPQDKELDSCIDRMNRLETSVVRPYLLEVLRLYDEQIITITEVREIFTTVESYLFRRMICDLPTNMLNKIFLFLHRDIVKYDNSTANYVEKFKYTLLSKRDKAKFPENGEFMTLFSERQVYQMNSKNKKYIMERYENFGTKEDKDVYGHLENGDFSIEHIMPQHLTPEWQKNLGSSYETIHSTWLHRMANLTLTAYNGKYSNCSFIQKKTMTNGFKDSGIRMNGYLIDKDKWDLEELEKRDKFLMDRAVAIWPLPTTSYIPEAKYSDTYTVYDTYFLTGKSITKFSYKNTEHSVTSWVEMFQQVIQMLYSEDASIIAKSASSENEIFSAIFSYDSNSFIRSMEIADGIYVNTNNSTSAKLNFLEKLLGAYGHDYDDLLFYVKNSK